MPVFLGEADVIKTIQTIPGVATIGEGAPGFFVRGGNADQNLILQDGIIFSNTSHALGFFSLFNPDLISSVQLFKGSTPAQYGGRLSSILDVKLKGNNYSTTSVNGGIGTVMSKIAVETPLVKNKISLLAGGRVSYADWLLPTIKIPEVSNSKAFFYDINVKISSRISDKGSISVGYFQSFDRTNFQEEAGFEWGIQGISLNWDQTLGQKLQSSFLASWGRNENLNFDPSGLDLTELNNGFQFYRLKETITLPVKDHTLVGGAEWTYYQPEDEVLTTMGSTDEQERVLKDFGQELGLFLNDEWELNNKLALSLGVRTSIFLSEERRFQEKTNPVYVNLEPRFSMRYGLTPSSSIKASYNRMNQYVHLLSNTTGILPIDQWVLSNSIIDPSTSNNFSAGYFRNFNANEWESSAEVFYRQMNNLIEFKDFADLILNSELEQEIVQGEGEAYGLEFYLRRHTGKVKGNISYTYSRTFIEAPILLESNELDRFAARFDRPHTVNLVMDWTVSRKSKFGLVFNFTSGRPITAPVSSYSLGNVVVPHYSDRNEYRVPSYHRLDISYTYRRNAVKKRRYQDSITFSIYNVYSRRNAFSVFFRKETNRPPQAYRLSVLGSAFPSITYTFEFK
jgi:outer membrane receptor for ferrienterochelin and colicin